MDHLVVVEANMHSLPIIMIVMPIHDIFVAPGTQRTTNSFYDFPHMLHLGLICPPEHELAALNLLVVVVGV